MYFGNNTYKNLVFGGDTISDIWLLLLQHYSYNLPVYRASRDVPSMLSYKLSIQVEFNISEILWNTHKYPCASMYKINAWIYDTIDQWYSILCILK